MTILPFLGITGIVLAFLETWLDNKFPPTQP